MPDRVKDVTERTDDAMAQIVRLREQVESLMRDRVAPAMGDAAERVGAAAGRMGAAAQDAADVARDRADALAGAVRGKPLIAICIAVVIGFMIGRTGRS